MPKVTHNQSGETTIDYTDDPTIKSTLESVSSEQGRFEGIGNYRHRDIPLDAADRQVVNGVAHRLGIHLQHTPTGETAQTLLTTAHGYAVQQLAYCSRVAKLARDEGYPVAAREWQEKADAWQMEEIRARLALQGKLRFN